MSRNGRKYFGGVLGGASAPPSGFSILSFDNSGGLFPSLPLNSNVPFSITDTSGVERVLIVATGGS